MLGLPGPNTIAMDDISRVNNIGEDVMMDTKVFVVVSVLQSPVNPDVTTTDVKVIAAATHMPLCP